MQRVLTSIFIEHPSSVNESYLQHMRFALGFAGLLAVAACAALIHALVPALCKSTASRIITHLNDRMTNRH